MPRKLYRYFFNKIINLLLFQNSSQKLANNKIKIQVCEKRKAKGLNEIKDEKDFGGYNNNIHREREGGEEKERKKT